MRGGFAFGVTLLALALGSPAQAAFPGANGKIAIDSFSPGIETINADGTGATLLASDGAGAEWSSDGTKIAFYKCSGACHIWVMNSDGTGQVQVTNGSFESKPSWSPDGSRLVFIRNSSEIWTVKANGADETLVASGLHFFHVYGAPQWSPDGTRIVFASHRETSPPEHPEIYTVRPDGMDMTRLTTANDQIFPCTAFPQKTYGPDWSPDGRKIVYVYWHHTADGDCTGPTSLHVMNVDGTGDHEVVGAYDLPDYIEGPPSWSPDGARLAVDGSTVTYVVNLSDRSWNFTENGSPTDWQPLPDNAPSAYARPKGASPSYISLVPAYTACAVANRAHGAPLAYGSCTPPAQASSNLTVGTPDANGKIANSLGFVQLITHPGVPGGPDDADVALGAQVKSVYNASDLSDYTGALEARLTIRLTNKEGAVSATTVEYPLSFALPCIPTADPSTGSTCTLISSADALRPGLVPEGRRSIWALDQARVYDGGADGDPGTSADNQLFQTQGLFVP